MTKLSQDKLNTLVEKARKAQNKSYSPYSNFKVGAAIETSSGNQYAGCNVENASYPLSQCAEATAIGQMVTSGDTEIASVVIVSPTEKALSPCGACRQKIAEFSSPDTIVYLVTSNNNISTHSIDELLPLGFGKDDLSD